MLRRNRQPRRQTMEWHRERLAELAEVRRIVAWTREHRGYGWLVTMERDGVMSEELPSEWARGVSRPRAAYLERLRQYAERFGYVRGECIARATTVGDSILLSGRSPRARTLDILRDEHARSAQGKAAAAHATLASLELIVNRSVPVSGLDLVGPTFTGDQHVPTPHPPGGGRVGEDLGPDGPGAAEQSDAAGATRKDTYAVLPTRASGPVDAPTKHNISCASSEPAAAGAGPPGREAGQTEGAAGGCDGGSPGPDPRRGGGGVNTR